MRWPASLVRRAAEPVDGASLATWRFGLGLILAVAHLRFVTEGWTERFYETPVHRFYYWLIGPVAPLPAPGMDLLHLLLAAAGVALAVSWRPRWMAALLALGTAYADAIDLTRYLNHHWLVVLLCALCAALPADGRVPRGALWLLRAQVAVVYTFAAVAKMGPDWLLDGQPLNTWLLARTDWPLLGRFFAYREAAVAMSWAGMLFDLTIVWWLSARRTRLPAFAVLLLFHGMTALLFRIGIFPWLMTVNATLFFDPSWPRRLGGHVVRWLDRLPVPTATRLPRWAIGLAALYLAIQVLLPLRAFLYPGNVLWAEEGMRFSWRVMVREKHGDVSFRVRLPDGRSVVEVPRRWLDGEQEREMASQPDLIWQLAQRVAADHRAAGHGEVAVFADAWVSLNGRPPRRMIDPETDLAQVSDTCASKPWILPGPTDRAAHLGRVAMAGGAR
ncbi:MAG: HTTM domain-containing protein [Deltaproteobacteria bacterium]|nr:HTTM domain-containing protein [Deltaproteobacteria bacterium]